MEEKGSNRFVFLLNRSEKTQAILVDKQQLPGILVGGKYPGVRLDFELPQNFNTAYLYNFFFKKKTFEELWVHSLVTSDIF